MIKVLHFILFAILILTTNAPTNEIEPNLYDPEQASPEIREKVMQGFKLMQFTNTLLPDNVGNKISCSNCHFNGGNSLGGKNNGISLVGVSFTYPRFNQRAKRDISLRLRINFCFERSMNGKALAEDSAEMDALIAYLDWISQGAKQFKTYPWLGLKLLTAIQHKPNAKTGKILYEQKCAGCHQSQGEGWFGNGMWIPPLAGNQTFNDGAGMASPGIFSSFIYWNMPMGQPTLTQEEALDIAEYVLSLPRPHFNKPK